MSAEHHVSYIEWAKLHSSARYNLAVSGLPAATFDDIGGPPTDMPLAGNNAYGYPPLVAAIASTYGVKPSQVMTTTGCSMANVIALAATVTPGDEVLIERPTYEPLLRAAIQLGAVIRRFDRPAAQSCRIDAAGVMNAISPRTKAVVLANLHNPSGQHINDAELQTIGEAAARVGARVIVDEVYLDCVPDPAQRSSVHLGSTFVATSSLTKIYGLSALRCGWILADTDVAKRAWRVADDYGNVQPFGPDWLATRAFEHLPTLRQRSLELLAANRATFDAWARNRQNAEYLATKWGTTVCLRPKSISASKLTDLLRQDYEVSVVPGHFFELPDYVRIALCVDPATLHEGLQRIEAALEADS